MILSVISFYYRSANNLQLSLLFILIIFKIIVKTLIIVYFANNSMCEIS